MYLGVLVSDSGVMNVDLDLHVAEVGLHKISKLYEK